MHHIGMLRSSSAYHFRRVLLDKISKCRSDIFCHQFNHNMSWSPSEHFCCIQNCASVVLSLFRGHHKVEEACEMYCRAANMFKMAKNWSGVISFPLLKISHLSNLTHLRRGGLCADVFWALNPQSTALVKSAQAKAWN